MSRGFGRTKSGRERIVASLGATALVSTMAWIQGAGLARAQDEAADPTAVDEIVVTGSRLARTGAEAPTPVTVLGSDRLEAMI